MLAFLGTLVGSGFGVLSASRLTAFRIAALEEKVDRHNRLVERMAMAERDIKNAHHRIDEIKRSGTRSG